MVREYTPVQRYAMILLPGTYRRKCQTSSVVRGLLVILALQAGSAQAENTLSLERTDPRTVELRLKNSQALAALQFTLHASSDASLSCIEKSARIAGGSWILEAYQPDASTFTVVLYSMSRQTINPGSGTILRFSVDASSPGPTDSVRVGLSGVVAADLEAREIAVETRDIAWAERDPASVPRLDGPAQLGENYPNPFNPSTTIPFTLGQPAQVELGVYDLAGRLVKTLVSEYRWAGHYSATWMGDDEAGRDVASGMYVLWLRAGHQNVSHRVILTR
jgi:hypothetical protein